MVHSNLLSCYKPELIIESYIPLIISIFSSECSVKVPHMTDSVDGALDETSTTTVHRLRKVVVQKGIRNFRLQGSGKFFVCKEEGTATSRFGCR